MKLERYMSLTEAAKAAGKIAGGWSFRGTDEKCNRKELLGMAVIHDDESGIETDEDTFYLLAPNGAIGFTEDTGEEIDWLYLPLDHIDDELPDSLAEAEAGGSEAKKRFCANCGGQISDTASFCPHCGTSVQNISRPAQPVQPTNTPQVAQMPQTQEMPQTQQIPQVEQVPSMPVVPPMPQLSGVMASEGAGEMALGTMTVNMLPNILSPLMTLKNMLAGLAHGFSSFVKNPAAVIVAALMAVFWIALGIMRAKGMGGEPVRLLNSLLLSDTSLRSVVGSFGSILGQSVLLGAVISLVRGGGKDLGSGLGLLPKGLSSFSEDKSAIAWAVIGAGAALLLYEIFVGKAQFTGILGSVAPASLVLMSWGQGSGMIHSLVQSVTANKVEGVLQENKSSLNGLYLGLTAGFSLALLLAIAGQNSLIIALGLFLPLLGLVLHFIFNANPKPAP